MLNSRKILLIFLFFSSIYSYSQTNTSQEKINPVIPIYSKAIEDNSFLMEEAYNQEDGVIQHISSLIREHSGNYNYVFTEEWPISSQTHQLSATIPFSYFNTNSVSGFGDIYINYRYQLAEHDDWITAAPRFSIILPTGNSENGLGEDVTGFQVNVPLSKRLSENLITHINVGFTTMPNSKTIISNKEISKTLTSYNFGVSLIWLVSYKLNFMLEYIGNYSAQFNSSGNVESILSNTLAPGMRYAIDLDNLQIVPGFALPINFEDGRKNMNLLLYLSFEHPI